MSYDNKNQPFQIESLIYDDEKMEAALRAVAKNITKERKRRNMSMVSLANMSDLSISHIFKLEHHQCQIGLKALLKIATALKIEPAKLLPDLFVPLDKAISQKPSAGDRFERITDDADKDMIDFVLKFTEIILKTYKGR